MRHHALLLGVFVSMSASGCILSFSDDTNDVQYCQTNAECASGYSCDTGLSQCVATATCGLDADCDAGWICDNRDTCIPTAACEPGIVCPSGFYCDLPRATCDLKLDGISTTCGFASCDAIAPVCPSGLVPVVENGCYNGECIVLEGCDTAPPCTLLNTESQCDERPDCAPVYTGENCQPGGGCEAFVFEYCASA